MDSAVVLSIIVVSYNTVELLKDCLRSIYRNREALSLEVIVVDNGSWDGSAEMLNREFPDVHLIRNQENRGFAAANNQGIRIAKGEYILLLNPDTVLLEGSLGETLQFMKSHPEAGIVGVRLLNQDGTIQQSCRSFPTVLNVLFEALFLYKVFPRSRLVGKYYMGWFNYDRVQEVDVVLGAFMMVRRSVFEKIGMFDEQFFMFTEETDFCIRAKRTGLKTYFFPGAEVIHVGGQSAEQDPERMFREIYHTQLYLFRKHYRFPDCHLMVLLRVAGMAIRVILYAFYGLVALKPVYLRKSKYYLTALVA